MPSVSKKPNIPAKGGALKRAYGGIARRPMVGMADPRRSIQPVNLNQIDQTMAGTGEALRGTMNRIASGTGKRRPVAKAEGGKIASGLSALRQLAKKFEQALDMEDNDTANMIARKMEAIQPGSSKEVLSSRPSADDDAKARSLKLSTFARGGKVKKKATGGVIADDEIDEEEAPAPKAKPKAKGPDPTAIGNRVIAFAKKEGCTVEDLLSSMESSYEGDESNESEENEDEE